MRYLNGLYAAGLLLLATACEKELPKFADTDCRLNFFYGDDLKTSNVQETMKVGSHSFKLNSAEGAMRDTVWLEVATMGALSPESRPVAFGQVMLNDTANAEAGKHYVAFDDPSLAELYQIPANAAKAKLPVVVLRDPSLETEGDVVLRITFRDNGYFRAGYPEFATYTLTISDDLTKPSYWDDAGLDYSFGVYGKQKHELMIKWTEKSWDNEYIGSLYYELFPGYLVAKDQAYINFLAKWFAERLEEENEARLADPEIGDVWREADGTEVDFTPEEWGYGY